ncbi:MAG: MarR family transcriptional regulator [Oscillospiraceae bacterium]|nr:MarR family transcriptional regulator [Oscillospiraceae bacterium]
MKYDSYNLEKLFRTFFHMRMCCAKKEFEKYEISPAGNPQILFTLWHKAENTAVSQKEIADRLGISAPTVAVSIKRMEKSGLVHKVADESDLRRNLITLTEKGREFIQDAQAVFDSIDEGALRGLSEQEREQLRTLFLRIVSNLETMGARPPENQK